MRTRKCFLWIVFLSGFLLIFACSKTSSTSQEPAPSPWLFHGVRIYIVSTGDIHEYSPNLASLTTLVKNFRDTAFSVYFVLAGDFFMAHHSYNVKRCDGHTDNSIRPDFKVPDDSNQMYNGLAESRMIEYLHFDAIVPGNHDWVYGISVLARNKLKAKLVACNIGQPADLAADYLSFYSGKGKFRLNIIGVAATDNIHYKQGEVVRVYPLTTSTSLSKIKNAIAKANINVLLTHLLDPDDESAFSALKDPRGEALFDVLCGGHTHESFATISADAAYMKAGLFGTYAGLACLWWDTVKMEVVKKDVRLVCLENIPKDPGALALIDSLHRVYPHY
jgi:2',3'-cyclic-nucleotide 2'-phosphodiesterase (5'-nucleotidase family)